MREIGREAVVDYWAAEFRPYLSAAARQFAPKQGSLTERMLDKMKR